MPGMNDLSSSWSYLVCQQSRSTVSPWPKGDAKPLIFNSSREKPHNSIFRYFSREAANKVVLPPGVLLPARSRDQPAHYREQINYAAMQDAGARMVSMKIACILDVDYAPLRLSPRRPGTDHNIVLCLKAGWLGGMGLGA